MKPALVSASWRPPPQLMKQCREMRAAAAAAARLAAWWPAAAAHAAATAALRLLRLRLLRQRLPAIAALDLLLQAAGGMGAQSVAAAPTQEMTLSLTAMKAAAVTAAKRLLRRSLV